MMFYMSATANSVAFNVGICVCVCVCERACVRACVCLCVCVCARTRVCRGGKRAVYLIKLSPGHHHITEVSRDVWLIKYLLGQEVQIVLVEAVLCLHLRHEFTVEGHTH